MRRSMHPQGGSGRHDYHGEKMVELMLQDGITRPNRAQRRELERYMRKRENKRKAAGE